MKHIWLFVFALFVVPVAGANPPQQEKPPHVPPEWAYGLKTPLGSPASEEPTPTPFGNLLQDVTTVLHLPGSTAGFTFAQIRSGPVDWYPGDHPEMPEIVARGRAPGVLGCPYCHYTNGKGDPANAAIQSLPYVYFLQTMEDFKNGARKSADSRKLNTPNMIAYAKAMTDEEIQVAAKYYGAIPFATRIKVIETKTVPKTRLVAAGLYFQLEKPGETEPLGNRLIEMPETPEAFIYKDPRSKATAYVPPGSIKKGEDLVMNGGHGKTIRCSICHGADLQGLGPVPGIAGRGPSYIVRQLFDMQSGSRNGVWASLMKPVVDKLTTDDMISIAAYLASRKIGDAQ